MSLPKSITPCPKKDAILEIRFASSIKTNSNFGQIYHKKIGTTSTVNRTDEIETIIPEKVYPYQSPGKDISQWSEPYIQDFSGVSVTPDLQKLQTLMEVAKNIVSNSKDLERIYVDMVNEHFWELL